MKTRYYLGLDNEKDLLFIELVKQLEKNKNIEIIKVPEKIEVIEMSEYLGSSKPTGKDHIGYEYHYITIKTNYNSIVYTISFPYFWAFEGVDVVKYNSINTGASHQIGYPSNYNINNKKDITKMINEALK